MGKLRSMHTNMLNGNTLAKSGKSQFIKKKESVDYFNDIQGPQDGNSIHIENLDYEEEQNNTIVTEPIDEEFGLSPNSANGEEKKAFKKLESEAESSEATSFWSDDFSEDDIDALTQK